MNMDIAAGRNKIHGAQGDATVCETQHVTSVKDVDCCVERFRLCCCGLPVDGSPFCSALRVSYLSTNVLQLPFDGTFLQDLIRFNCMLVLLAHIAI